MPHLSFEYSAGLEALVDLPAFAAAMRDAMAATGLFPLGGIRVRGHRADVSLVADGGPHHFVDMAVRLGSGRSLEARKVAAEAIYAAAETFLRPCAAGGGFALSLEMREIDPELSIKRFNTIHEHLRARSEA